MAVRFGIKADCARLDRLARCDEETGMATGGISAAQEMLKTFLGETALELSTTSRAVLRDDGYVGPQVDERAGDGRASTPATLAYVPANNSQTGHSERTTDL
jgi:hypothetical protein